MEKAGISTSLVPEGQVVNQIYYLKVLTTQERVRKKWPELWKNKLWILHQDNTPAHNAALSVKRYLATRSTTVLEHTLYLPDLPLCDFFLFPKIKPALKRTWFESMEEVKQKLAKLLNVLTKEDFQHCFDQWKKWMERYAAREGENTEEDLTLYIM